MTRLLKPVLTVSLALATVTSLVSPGFSMPVERGALTSSVAKYDVTQVQYRVRDIEGNIISGSDLPRRERPRNGVDGQQGWVQERPRDYDPERGVREHPRSGVDGQSGVVREYPRNGVDGQPGVVREFPRNGVDDQSGVVREFPRDRGARERPRDGHYGERGVVRERPRDGYYNGHRGSRERRPGYREHNGYWYPLAAFAVGAIIGGALNQQKSTPSYGGSHQEWCANRWRSYRAYDNSYQPNNGPRKQCVSPYMR